MPKSDRPADRHSMLIDLLEAYQKLDLLRPLDLQFAKFIYALEAAQSSPEQAERVAGYAALVSHYTGRGHVCVSLQRIYNEQGSNPFDFDSTQLLRLTDTRSIDFDRAQDLQQLSACHVISADASTPLVLQGNNLYLNRYWQYERTITDYFKQRQRLHIDQELLALVLDRMFPVPLSAAGARTADTAEIDYQKVAAAVALTNSVSVITGGPGTGKTYTVVRLLASFIDYMQRSGADLPLIKLAAPTGKAAARMLESVHAALDELSLTETQRNSFPHQASTLHRLLGSLPNNVNFRHHRDNPLHLDILIVDEASMIDLPMMAKLLDAMPTDARLVLIGDKDQLASVEAGAVLNDLCQGEPRYSKNKARELKRLTGFDLPVDNMAVFNGIQDCLSWLQVSRRFGVDSGIGHLARAINHGDTGAVLDTLQQHQYQDIAAYALSETAYKTLLDQVAKEYEAYLLAARNLDYRQAFRCFMDIRLLCALREGLFGVSGLNQQIERRLEHSHAIDRQGEWYEGRPVIINRNDHALQLYNGDIGIAMQDEEGRLRVYFEAAEGTRSVLPSRIPEHETAYAMTVHKSQGSEFTHTVLILPDKTSPVVTRELIYTGVTRAKKRLSLLYNAEVLAAAVIQRVVRFSGLADSLQ